jgi:hypothetical protein
MLVAWLVLIGVVAVAATAVSLRRRSHDDVHSVEGYHRQLHTLEVIRTHTDAEPGAAFPESTFKVSTHATVRLTEPGQAVVPPVPPPPVPDPDRPVTFDDAGSVASTPVTEPGSDWREDRAMQGINHRPRRLAAPATAVAAVSLIIVLLLVFGSHSVPPHHPAASAGQHTTTTVHSHTTTTVHSKVKTKARTTRHGTTTTTVPVVSLPHAGSAHTAVYAVKPGTYSLAMSATSSECWVDATEAGSGTVLYTGILSPGQTQTVNATGAVSLEVGAPNSFAANIDGTAVSFPFGYLAPFTMQFLPAGNQAT